MNHRTYDYYSSPYENAETSYIQILANIITNGEWKEPWRKNYESDTVEKLKGGRNLCLFGQTIRHNMRIGFPLLTTKKMTGTRWDSMVAELFCFCNGITSKKFFSDTGCKIWNEWANPKHLKILDEQYKKNGVEKTKEELIREVDDLGPIYGSQWRNWGLKDRIKYYDSLDSIDQLTEALIGLATRPHDRRFVVSAWNPTDFPEMGLVPCHFAFQFVVTGSFNNPVLNLQWTQRSCDWPLGVPFNIASYALLLTLTAEWLGMRPGVLKGDFNDAHVYENQIGRAREQIKRAIHPAPKLKISEELKDKWSDFRKKANKTGDFNNFVFSFYDWVPSDVSIDESTYEHSGVLTYPRPVV